MKDTTIKLLQREDQSFLKDHFDFDFLKSEGLKHIGALSGNIWTDHNVHDPGITILEMVAYALMDLGYRTQLPIQDILASPNGSADDSYFTPAQILSNNPTTILDYRKLLIAIEGVQNAWLIPSQKEKYIIGAPILTLDDCKKHNIDCPSDSSSSTDTTEFTLNGLYNVCIQKEPNTPLSDQELQQKVLEKLHAHRNLCEDFAEIKILCEEEIGICADVNIERGQDPEKVYIDLIVAIEQFLSPRIAFYTLQEMLEEKGKLIEEVFEGRPFDPDYNSPGFIDVEELENIPLRKEIHLSDLYSVINAVEGVASVQNISLNGTTLDGAHESHNDDDCLTWIFHLATDHVPVFSPEKSCIKLARDGAVFQLDEFEIQRLKSQNLKTRPSGRARGNKSYLDLAIPNGQYRPDLGTYYSIQNEFPSVYGIGEGGLPDSASKKRVAQALQLKGYLLFFDQLLVNYLSQLANARNLFSFKTEVEQISQSGALDSVPDLEKLLQFYNTEQQQPVVLIPVHQDDFSKNIAPDNVQAVLENRNPLEYDFDEKKYTTTNKFGRDIQVDQLVRELSQENYSIEVHPTEQCFYFIIQPSSLPIVLLARAVFNSKEEAEIAANNISYVGTKKDNYQLINKPSQPAYSFDLVFSPTTNTSLAEELTETKQTKLDKRNLFLDHLLARFSESFTEYSLLLFSQLNNKEEVSQSLINAKTNFLSNYPDISGNRGKAFNYLDREAIWGAKNISGLEKRLLAFTGLENWEKNYLCNFEVHRHQPEYQVDFKYNDKTIFKTKNVYDTENKAINICKIILDEATENSFYAKKDLKDCYLIVFNGSKKLEPLAFDNPTERDLCYNAIRNLFHQAAAPDHTNVYPSAFVYHHELYTAAGIAVAKSNTSFKTEQAAISKQNDFVGNIKDQQPIGGADLSNLKLTTKRVNDRPVSIDKSTVNPSVKVADSEYRWQIMGIDKKPILTGIQYVRNQSTAFDNYLKTVFTKNKKWEIKENSIQLLTGHGKVLAEQAVSSKTAGELIAEEAAQLLDADLIAEKHLKETGDAYGFEIRNAANRLLLKSTVLYENKNLVQNLAEAIQLDNYDIVPNEESRFSIEFKDGKGRAIATSSEPASDPFLLLEQILSNRDQLKVVKKSSTYTFKITKENTTEELLEGFTRYDDPENAFRALFRFLEEYKNKKLKFREITDGEIDLAKIELHIIDEQGNFIAFSPKEHFRKREYWKKEIKAVQKTLKDFSIPLDFSSASKFYLADQQGKELLRSLNYFPNPNAARSAGRTALFYFSQLKNIGDHIVRAGAQNTFALELGKHQSLLTFSINGKLPFLENQLEVFQQTILEHTYLVNIAPAANKWRHRFFWLDKNGKALILYDSKDQFNTEKKANEAYQNFLTAKTDLEFSQIKKGDKYGFQIKNGGKVLIHPTFYPDAQTGNEVINDVISLLQFFNLPEADQTCVYTTPQSPDIESFVYRVYKKGNPIAFHPCDCFELNQDGTKSADYRVRLEELCERQYVFPAFYLRGNKMICLLNGRYHYVLKNRADDKIYFTSKQSYYSKKEAVEAFNHEYLKLIHLASDINNYLELTLKDGSKKYCLGKKIENALATFSESIFTDKESVAQKMCSFPIRIKGTPVGELCYDDNITGYFFHLAGENPLCETDWISTACYDSPAEAWKDFHHFLNLLKNKSNYRPQLKPYLNKWQKEVTESSFSVKGVSKTASSQMAAVPPPATGDPCCCYISVTEVLAESCFRYSTALCAWGEKHLAPVYSRNVFLSLDNACCIAELLLPDNLSPDVTIETIEDHDGKDFYYFKIEYTFTKNGDQLTYHFTGETFFEERIDAENAGIDLLDTIRKNELTTTVVQGDDCLYRIALVRPCEEPEIIELPCSTAPGSCQGEFNTPKGLNRLLEAACEEGAFVPCIIEDKKSCYFTFKVVEPATYFFAHHPHQFHAREDRDKMMGWIFDQLKGKNTKFELIDKPDGKYALQLCAFVDKTIDGNTPDEIVEENYIYYVNAPAGFNPFNLLWSITDDPLKDKYCLFEIPRLFTREEIDDAGFKTIKECYESNINFLLTNNEHLEPTGDFNEQNPGIALVNPNCLLAKHPQLYTCEEDMWAAIEATKAHINTEGMHLLEHILLRPEKVISSDPDDQDKFDCTCTLLATPDPDCIFPLPEEDIDRCLIPVELDEDGNEVKPTYVPGADPYSFWATTIFPCWSKRYQDTNFRTYVTNTLLREAPAHVALNQLWLSPLQFCKFEDQYRQWLHYKAGRQACETDMPCDLIKCLMNLKSCCPESGQQGDKNCECDTPTFKANLQAVGINQLFNITETNSPFLGSQFRNFTVADNQVVFDRNKLQASLSANLRAEAAVFSPPAATPAPAVSPAGPSATLKEKTGPAEKAESQSEVKSKTKTNQPTATTVKPAPREKAKATPPSKADNASDPGTPRPFLSKIKTVKDANVLRSKTYTNILAYAETVAKKKVTKTTIKRLLDDVILYSIRYAIGKKGGGDDKFYTRLLADSIALTLDKLVAQNREKVFHADEFRHAFAKMKDKGISLAAVKRNWNSKALKSITDDAPAIELYLQLFKL
ncbi:MAG: hypothetical protein AAFZ15_11890 [Bacteroidota bacterium]